MSTFVQVEGSMKPLQRRVNKLESSMLSETDLPVIFINFVGAENGRPNGYERVGQAIIPGTSFGQINRGEYETEDAFYRRVYAMKEGGKPIEDMTEEELEIAMAAGDKKLAQDRTELQQHFESATGLSKLES